MKKQRKFRAPNRIYPVGFVMDREEFMFRCFMVGAKKIHKRLSDKRVKLNIHNNYDWKSIHSNYTGRGMVWFNVKMGKDYDMFWQDWESECKKLKMRYKITSDGTWTRNYRIRLEW
jgi:hypothetical protein